jgi:50S ribosomal protein L16 3-hydroxylase
LADAAITEHDPESHELSLLKPFKSTQTLTAEDGDVLYLPPGIPHWGVADTLCLTYSIGMRAPNVAELCAGYERLLAEAGAECREITAADTQRFYQDPDLSSEESTPGCISAAAIARTQHQHLLPGTLSNDQVAVVLGCVVTDPKAWLEPERLSKNTARQWLDQMSGNEDLSVHGMARLAFFAPEKAAKIFANGSWHPASQRQCAFIGKICAARKIDKIDVEAIKSDSEYACILEWLLMQGVFHRDA